jgi:hypothetical protein
MCSIANHVANAVIYRAVHNYKKAYITPLSLVPLLVPVSASPVLVSLV